MTKILVRIAGLRTLGRTNLFQLPRFPRKVVQTNCVIYNIFRSDRELVWSIFVILKVQLDVVPMCVMLSFIVQPNGESSYLIKNRTTDPDPHLQENFREANQKSKGITKRIAREDVRCSTTTRLLSHKRITQTSKKRPRPQQKQQFQNDNNRDLQPNDGQSRCTRLSVLEII